MRIDKAQVLISHAVLITELVPGAHLVQLVAGVVEVLVEADHRARLQVWAAGFENRLGAAVQIAIDVDEGHIAVSGGDERRQRVLEEARDQLAVLAHRRRGRAREGAGIEAGAPVLWQAREHVEAEDGLIGLLARNVVDGAARGHAEFQVEAIDPHLAERKAQVIEIVRQVLGREHVLLVVARRVEGRVDLGEMQHVEAVGALAEDRILDDLNQVGGRVVHGVLCEWRLKLNRTRPTARWRSGYASR
jgi:hypothetical protein